MAKRKKSRSKVTRNYSSKTKKGNKRRKTGVRDTLVTRAIISGGYSYVREKFSTQIMEQAAKVPVLNGVLSAAPQYADEIVFGGASYLLAKGKMPMFKGATARKVGQIGLILEVARLGTEFANKGFNPSAKTTNGVVMIG